MSYCLHEHTFANLYQSCSVWQGHTLINIPEIFQNFLNRLYESIGHVIVFWKSIFRCSLSRCTSRGISNSSVALLSQAEMFWELPQQAVSCTHAYGMKCTGTADSLIHLYCSATIIAIWPRARQQQQLLHWTTFGLWSSDSREHIKYVSVIFFNSPIKKQFFNHPGERECQCWDVCFPNLQN